MGGGGGGGRQGDGRNRLNGLNQILPVGILGNSAGKVSALWPLRQIIKEVIAVPTSHLSQPIRQRSKMTCTSTSA